MLKNGAETYRVEDTIMRLCETMGLDDVQVFVIPTGIFLSVDYKGELLSCIDRTRIKRIDLEKIVMINDFVRNFPDSGMTFEEGLAKLREINKGKTFPLWFRYLFSGFAGGFFTLLYQGSLPEFILSLISSVLVTAFMDIAARARITYFLRNIFGGALSAFFSLILIRAFFLISLAADPAKVIVGPLMTLVPGVAMTNAVRDIISGDLVAGGARLLDAVFTAIAIALGAGIILKFGAFLKG